MVVLDDFSRIPEGRDIPDAGHVKRCPRCGRSGVIHAQISEVIGDGMRVEPQDCCALPRCEMPRTG